MRLIPSEETTTTNRIVFCLPGSLEYVKLVMSAIRSRRKRARQYDTLLNMTPI